MKTTLFFLLLIFTSLSTIVSAQNDDTETTICRQPISSKFDEFDYTKLEDVKEKLDVYGLQLKNQKAYGVIIGYGGKETEADQGRSIASAVEKYLRESLNLPPFAAISVRNGGNREKPSVELFIKPEYCSSEPEPSPTLKPDEIVFKEEKEFFTKDISRKSVDELNKLLIKKADPPYPLAARAVRAGGSVLLLVIVDENGNVANTKVLEGHPLLRQAAAAAVKNWKYKTLKENNKPVKFGGRIGIDFDKLAENLPKLVLNQ